MSRVASPGSSSATIPLNSEASWDSCQPSCGSASVPESDVIPGAYEFDDLASEPDAESPTPPNKDITLPEPTDLIDKVDESLEPPEDSLSALAISESRVDPDFCFDDSNITIKASLAEKRLFCVHQYKLKEFENIKPLVEASQMDSEGRKTIELSGSADDFHNMLTILYSSAYAPQIFSATALKSTLHLSTMHGHPQLRTFSIESLEKLRLPPIERFALSRDCAVDSWMSSALDDLCSREAPISVAEAQILGTEKFVEIAARREGAKFERGGRAALAAYPPALIEMAPSPVSNELAPVPSTDTRTSTTASATGWPVSFDLGTPPTSNPFATTAMPAPAPVTLPSTGSPDFATQAASSPTPQPVISPLTERPLAPLPARSSGKKHRGDKVRSSNKPQA